jgi:hypothetical protein
LLHPFVDRPSAYFLFSELTEGFDTTHRAHFLNRCRSSRVPFVLSSPQGVSKDSMRPESFDTPPSTSFPFVRLRTGFDTLPLRQAQDRLRYASLLRANGHTQDERACS